MTDRLSQLLHDEAAALDVPPPPTAAILAAGKRRQHAHRTRTALAVAATVVAVVGGVVGVTRLTGGDDAPPPAGPVTPAPPTLAPLEISGSGVGAAPFGTPEDEVLADLTARFGTPDVAVGPARYSRVAGQEGWFESADDPLSPSWAHPVTAVTCWGTLCVIFGGDSPDTLQLRGWELSQVRRWSEDQPTDLRQPDVRLAGSGVRLGDSWETLHAAYPRTAVKGGEGATPVVDRTPWPGISDGVGAWRLSGVWDFTQPNRAPEGAVVTRLSAGEGPEPGCC